MQVDCSLDMMNELSLKRLVVMLIYLVVVVTAGCYPHRMNETQELQQGVVGTVWLKPGFDGEDAHYALNPPDLTPRPLVGAKVYLMKYSSGHLNSRDIIATTVSDSLGRFKLLSRPGTYYLACFTTDAMTVVLGYTSGDTVGADFPINVFLVVTIQTGEFIGQSLLIEELLPQ